MLGYLYISIRYNNAENTRIQKLANTKSHYYKHLKAYK